ncbi:MAG: hypothetical protein C0505_01255 [Leptothrix sp. (in: Bacteria)]|nr:hypothetical protein [Leptothrix sp. (in: b-proteobacteria)]
MNKPLVTAALGVGLLVVGWVGWGYLGSNTLALAMTLLIAVFYVAGALELKRFRRATAGLQAALAAPVEPAAPSDRQPALTDWLATLPAALRHPVRQRIESERAALPGPVMTPYLVGLLVLLGMLGTFVGMVVTLDGAVTAMQSTTDLPTLRAALAAPVKGLGLAFGTSVAGVAASAMLGLASALCRRERLLATQALDALITTRLRPFSPAHQREQTLAALQAQARVMPEVADKMLALMAQIERQGEAMHQRLLDGQALFHDQAQARFGALASSVDASLRHGLSEGARLAGATLQPAVEATMAGITRETAAFQQRLADSVQQAQARGALDAEQRTARLLAAVEQSQAAQLADATMHDQQRLAAWADTLAAMTGTLQQQWQEAGAATLARQQQICQTLEQTASAMQARADTHARAHIDEMARLIDAAAAAPRAAAEVVAALRDKLADTLARDNTLLEERGRLMATLGTLLETVNQAAAEQRGVIDTLVASSAAVLQQAGARLDAQVEAESARLSSVAAQVTGSAVEVASLGEAFGVAVQLFSDTSTALAGQLQRIEAALGKSSARSDEQLAYYVAQAREIVDLSISSQRQIVDDLQGLALRQAPRAGVAVD